MSKKARTSHTSGEAAFLVAEFPVSLRLKLKAAAKRREVSLREFVIAALRRAVK